MTESNPSNHSDNETHFEWIDPIRDRFDKAWQAVKTGASRPCLEEYATEAGTDEKSRRKLLHQLIPVDIEYRRRCGDNLLAQDYLDRFTELDCTWLENELKRQDDSASNAGQPAPLPSTYGKYTLDTELGHGGFGSVYLALDNERNRRVALKRLLPRWSNDSKLRESLLQESRVVEGLNHPNIVRVLESGEVANTVYIAFELIDGEDLKSWLKQHRPTPIEAVKLLLPVVDAISAAHRADLVHRDLKPANILIDKQGKTYVTDFGLAATDLEMISGKQTGFAGTKEYMAPEQLWDQGHRVGERTDVFALGVILYEMLTGHHPWPFDWRCDVVLSQKIQAFRKLIDERPLTSPRRHNPDISESLLSVCLKALEVHPARRHIDCVELAVELRRAIGVPSWAEELDESEIQRAIAGIQPGPGLDPRILGTDFLSHLAHAIPNHDDALATVRYAGEFVRRDVPQATIIEDIHLPAATVPMLRVWGAIFTEACLHGPRMLAALLLVLPKKRIANVAVEKLNSLLALVREPHTTFRNFSELQ